MKMRNLGVIIALLISTAGLPAQITITSASFPAAGDSLKTATDLNPINIVVTAPGGPFTWDYTSLQPSTRQTLVFQPAANGSAYASFPNAELVTIANAGPETYFDVSSSAFSILGVSGSDLGGGLPFATELVFDPPLPERHAPLSFPNVFNPQTSFGFAISINDIPGGILDSLGVPPGLFDSIGIKITIKRNVFVDAYGTLAIPGGMYNVLREKRTDFTDTRLEIHFPILGWQDVTDLLGVGGFGQDTTTTYSFLTNTAKEPIAVLTMDSSGLVTQEAEYKDNGVQSAVEVAIGSKSEVIVSPNPVSDLATFEFKNLEPGQFTLRLFNQQGQAVLVKNLGSNRESVSLKYLSAGMYYFNVSDGKNRMVATGSLMKANP